MAVLVKNRGGRRRVSTRNNSRDDRRWRQASSAAVRDKGALQLSLLRVILVHEGDLGLRPAAHLTRAVRDRYRPAFIGTAIAAYIPWLVLPPGGRGPRTIEVVIVDVCLAVVSTNHGPSTVETSLDFRGSADKRPAKKGPHANKLPREHGPLQYTLLTLRVW